MEDRRLGFININEAEDTGRSFLVEADVDLMYDGTFSSGDVE